MTQTKSYRIEESKAKELAKALIDRGQSFQQFVDDAVDGLLDGGDDPDVSNFLERVKPDKSAKPLDVGPLPKLEMQTIPDGPRAERRMLTKESQLKGRMGRE